MQLVRFGFDINYVLDLDIESFDILVGYVLDMAAVERVEDLWTNFVATQGDKQSVKRFAQEFSPRKKKGRTPQKKEKPGADRSRRS